MQLKLGFVAGLALALEAGAITLPQNTCVVSGDFERPHDGTQSLTYTGALDSFWRSRVLEIASVAFRSCPPKGCMILVR